MDTAFPGKTCIVSIGETAYVRWGQATKREFVLAIEAIQNVENFSDAVLMPLADNGFCKKGEAGAAPVSNLLLEARPA